MSAPERSPPPPKTLPALPAGEGGTPIEIMRAYARMSGVSVDPPVLPLALVPADVRAALFRSLAPGLDASLAAAAPEVPAPEAPAPEAAG